MKLKSVILSMAASLPLLLQAAAPLNARIKLSSGTSFSPQWREVTTSFTPKGIHTYLATNGSNSCATVSTTAAGDLSGWLYSPDGTATQLASKSGKSLVPTGVKFEAIEPTLPQMHRTVSATGSSELLADEDSLVYNDDRIHIYRTALAIDYFSYNYYFYNSMDRVRVFWSQVEAMLNEIIGKQAGIYFQVVDNEALVMTSSDAKYPGTTSSYTIINYGTGYIDDLIGEDAYDFGCFIANLSDQNGLSKMAGAGYMKNYRGGCTAIATPLIVVHEAVHMFGSIHTNSDDNYSTYKSEPGSGTSIMASYNTNGWISLLSLNRIRRFSANGDMSYYLWPDRTQLIEGSNNVPGKSSYNNYVYALPSVNRPPVIDRTGLRTEYTIPHGTLFQFDIPATDPDGDELEYAAQQVNFNKKSEAVFRCMEPQSSSLVQFKPRYEWSVLNRSWSKLEYTDVDVTGTYYFWIGVNDLSPDPENFLTKPHAVGYDVMETKVNFVEGTPFKITNTKATSYTAGQRITLTWSVDSNVYGSDSKVRILLSDDFGETYNYVLKESAPNNGSCQVILPPDITIGQVTYGDTSRRIRGGVIKVEVVDDIAFALTEVSPVIAGYNNDFYEDGGFSLLASKISFVNLPERRVVVNSTADLPEPADVQAYSGTTQLDVTYTETTDDNVVSRVWEATDASGNTAAFEQIIVVEQKSTGETGPTSSIGEVNVEALPSALYSLQGRKVTAPRRGEIYVSSDGQKISLK